MKKMLLGLVSLLFLSQISYPGYGDEVQQGKMSDAKRQVFDSFSKVSRKIIQRADIKGTHEELCLMLVEFAPGYATPPHIHPVVGLNYIIEGTAESQYEGEPLRVFKAGDSYQDEANRKHLIFRNPSKTDILKFLIVFKIKKNQPFMRPL